MRTKFTNYPLFVLFSICLGLPALAERPEIKPISPGSEAAVPGYNVQGMMYQIDNLVWSGNAPRRMTHHAASYYCRSLGENSRLPTYVEARRLLAALGQGPEGDYNPDLIEGMRKSGFWTSTIDSTDSSLAYFVFGNDGYVDLGSLRIEIDVRCVTPV